MDVSNDNITGLLFPIVDRKNINNIDKRDTMGLCNVIETYIEDEEFNAKGIYYDENGNKDDEEFNDKGIYYDENGNKDSEDDF